MVLTLVFNSNQAWMMQILYQQVVDFLTELCENRNWHGGDLNSKKRDSDPFYLGRNFAVNFLSPWLDLPEFIMPQLLRDSVSYSPGLISYPRKILVITCFRCLHTFTLRIRTVIRNASRGGPEGTSKLYYQLTALAMK